MYLQLRVVCHLLAEARVLELHMATLQERAPEATPDEWWAEMPRVFDTDWPQHLPK